MKVIGVNGIFTLPGGNNLTTDTLLRQLKEMGLPTYDFNNTLVTILKSYSDELLVKHAKDLCKCSWANDSVIGHSRGCLVIHRACTLGAKYNKIYLFNAAMDSDLVWPAGCANQIINIIDTHDLVLVGGALLPFNHFGLMGRRGYKGPEDKRIVDYNAYDSNFKHTFLGHSDCFLPENINIWARLIKTQLT